MQPTSGCIDQVFPSFPHAHPSPELRLYLWALESLTLRFQRPSAEEGMSAGGGHHGEPGGRREWEEAEKARDTAMSQVTLSLMTW
jgi:hypothetical protein